MIIDSSALVAILKQESGWELYATALDSAPRVSISAATYVEISIVADQWKNANLSLRIDELIEQFQIVLEPFSPEQARIAREAYRNFGKGSGHAASLNFGDCFSYALARVKREPILFKGEDFIHTDLRPALLTR